MDNPHNQNPPQEPAQGSPQGPLPPSPQGHPPGPPSSIPTAPPPPSSSPPPPPTGSVGAPPPPEVSMRTLDSDTKSIEGGASLPVPESVLLPADEKEPEFKPETNVAAPILDAPSSTNDAAANIAPPKKFKKFLVVLLGIVIIIALGAAGYFLYPVFFSSSPDVVIPSPVSMPAPAPKPEPRLHSSLFLSPATETAEIKFESLNVVTINKSIDQLTPSQLESPSFQEVVMLDADGNQIVWADFVSELVDSFDRGTIASMFGNDFTAWIYYDENGRWPGYSVRLKPTTPIKDALDIIAPVLEDSASAQRFYLTPPGTLGEFADGTVDGHPVRYAVGSAPGAAFDYAIIKNILLISTSFDGAKEAVQRFGL